MARPTTPASAPNPVPPAAPSLRIAAELRRRIETGELRPGDRVPSTRAITAEWGVAMATATKVLTALREAGLVRAVRGVGTVVAEHPDRSARADRPDRPRTAAIAVPSVHPRAPRPNSPASESSRRPWRSPTNAAWRRCRCGRSPPNWGWPR